MFNTTSLVKREEEAVSASQVLVAILDVAKTPGVDISIAERLFALQQQMVADQRKMDFDDAMQRLQAKIPQMEKYGKGKNAKFVKYDDMDAIVRPLLAEESFSISFSEEEQKDGKVRFALEVSRAGHSKFYYRTISTDSAASNREGKSIRPAIQDDGSTTSYARRYLLKMALNIVEKGEDTDGNKSEAINGQEVATILTLLKETKSNEAEFLKYMNVATVGDITVKNFKTAINALETKKRNMAPPKPATPPPIHETKPGVVEPDGQAPMVIDPELAAKKWFIRIEQAPTVDMLKEAGLLLAQTDDPLTDDHRKTARALYGARMKQLKDGLDKPLIQDPPKPTGEEPWI